MPAVDTNAVVFNQNQERFPGGGPHIHGGLSTLSPDQRVRPGARLAIGQRNPRNNVAEQAQLQGVEHSTLPAKLAPAAGALPKGLR